MSVKEKIDKDLKSAMLSKDKQTTTALRGLKSAILYSEVEKGKREQGLSDEETVALLQKEAKKRQESADLYQKGGNKDKADAELKEKEMIESYLPEQISDEELDAAIDKAVQEAGGVSRQQMGAIIGKTKQFVGGGADGARIAKFVNRRINS